MPSLSEQITAALDTGFPDATVDERFKFFYRSLPDGLAAHHARQAPVLAEALEDALREGLRQLWNTGSVDEWKRAAVAAFTARIAQGG